MRKIALRGKYGLGKFALVDDEDFESLSRHKWYVTERGRARRRNDEGTGNCSMSREIMGFPEGEVDHANRDKLDNQKSNLRVCSHRQNNGNKGLGKTNTSGFKGVSWRKRDKVWEAGIKHKGKTIHIGNFQGRFEAAEAYDAKATELFGEFAWTNFPSEL